jgi:hypothetical protein
MVGFSLTILGLVLSEWGARKEGVSVKGVICFRILLYTDSVVNLSKKA